MTAFVCLLYCFFNWATWSKSETDRFWFLARLVAGAFVLLVIQLSGDASETFVGLVAQFLLLIDFGSLGYAIEGRDPRLYGAQQ